MPKKEQTKKKPSAPKPKKSAPKPKKNSAPVKITLRKGGLEGYHVKDLARDRRAILEKHLKSGKETYGDMIKRINVLAIYNKNKNPVYSDKFRKDIAWLQRHHKPQTK